MRSLVLLLTLTAAFLSCGEAGFQVRVGDVYDDNVAFTIQGLPTSTGASGSLSIEETTDEYGLDIIDSQIGVVTVTVRQYTQAGQDASFNADATLVFTGSDGRTVTFNIEDQLFSNNSSFQLNPDGLDEIAINSTRVAYSWEINTIDEPFNTDDNAFSIDVNTEIFLTIQVEEP